MTTKADLADLTKIKNYLQYTPETGNFTWVISNNPTTPIGSIAGSMTERGYIKIRIFKKVYLAHRLAYYFMYNIWPPNEIDHINNIKNDNRIDNLRLCNRNENMQNSTLAKNNLLGIKGLGIIKRINRNTVNYYIKARLNCNLKNETKYFRFYNEIDKIEAINKAKNWIESRRSELHKEFACNG